MNYNTSKILYKCLNSICKHFPATYEVIIIDNKSTDNSIEIINKFKKKINLKLIQNKNNEYFSKAYNQAAKKAKGEILLILNSDIILNENIGKAIDFIYKNSEYGIVTVRHDLVNGKVDQTCSRKPTKFIDFCESNFIGRFVPTREKIVSNYRMANWSRKTSRDVEIAPGSFILIKRDLFISIGGFNEKMKLFYSDTDLCIKVLKKGLKIRHIGDIGVLHFRQTTTKIINSEIVNKLWNGDKKVFYNAN